MNHREISISTDGLRVSVRERDVYFSSYLKTKKYERKTERNQAVWTKLGIYFYFLLYASLKVMHFQLYFQLYNFKLFDLKTKLTLEICKLDLNCPVSIYFK